MVHYLFVTVLCGIPSLLSPIKVVHRPMSPFCDKPYYYPSHSQQFAYKGFGCSEIANNYSYIHNITMFMLLHIQD